MLSPMMFLAPLLAGMLMSVQLHAAPAPWYQWRSKVDGKQTCSQTPLGPGWEKAAGPFSDSRCEKRIVVK
ncbi:hypothetical protein [Massilia sp. S19_KUP03_FR1]|uniref:hypothetical protein n=1 Tax=Massilia sp. S19_KUP03_FR1 TaxID=3025503 RepID=UPI002FCD73A2